MSRRTRKVGNRLGRRTFRRGAHGSPLANPHGRRLRLEPLEDRRMLALLLVNSDLDNSIAGDGLVTLREAVDAANAAGTITDLGDISDPGLDSIVFDPGLDGSAIKIDNLLGTLAIKEDLTIDAGPLVVGLRIDAGHGFDLLPATFDGITIFSVDDGLLGPSISVEMVGLTLTGGDTPGEGGAIDNHEILKLTDVTITDNAAVLAGGGIHSLGDLTLDLSEVDGNLSGALGGGIASDGNLTIDRTSISGNMSPGGIGGGLFAHTGGGYLLSVTNSTISGNTATLDGGGLYLSTTLGGVADIANTTVATNYADGNGGGIHNYLDPASVVKIRHSTITNNFSDADFDGIGFGGGISATGAGALGVDHSIVAENFGGAVPSMDISGLAAGTYNLIGVDTGLIGIVAGMSGNMVGTVLAPIDPLLSTLSDHGGPTETHALLPGSPAIDMGDPAFAGPPFEDQRGAPFARVDFASLLVDIGAYEVQDFGGPVAWVVDTLADESDGNYLPGDLSLREAIGLANGNAGFHDSITFDPALAGGTIVLTDGELRITDDVTIDAAALGGGMTIEAFDPTPAAGDGSRIFNINDNNFFSHLFVVLRGLNLVGADSAGDGGAIFNFEDLTLSNVRIMNNSAAGDGGGLFSLDGLVVINRSTISGNVAAADGGGLYVATGFYGGLTINDSTISGNVAGVNGGGIGLINDSPFALISNSTLSGNRANGDGGGGFFFTAGPSTTEIEHTTITENVVDLDGVGGDTGGGTHALGPGAFEIDHTIVAANINTAGLSDDLDGTTTATYSLIGIDTTGTIIDVAGNQIGLGIPILPLLGPLSNNGGPTLTHALLSGSPAIDTGIPGFAPPPMFDQRGDPFLRVDPLGAAIIDIGAYERYEVPGFPGWVVDTLADESDGDYSPGDLSLREAIGLANGFLGLGIPETITFSPLLAGGVIELSPLLGQLDITDDVVIDASALPGGVTVTAYDPTPGLKNGDGMRVFNIDDHDAVNFLDVKLAGLTLTGGDVVTSGGAIRNLETLTIADSTISGNATVGPGAFGGGIYNATGALTIDGSTVSGNSVSGVLVLGGGIFSGGDLFITDSSILGNAVLSGPGVGGGILAGASLTLTRSSVSGNFTLGASNSGGIDATAGGGPTLTIESSTISGNSTSGNGGGISIGTDSFTIDSSTISGNAADGDGGGILFSSGAAAVSTISHSTITDNTADADGGGGGAQAGGGIATTVPIIGTLELDHTILADNHDANNVAPDIKIALVIGALDATHSLVGDNAGSTLVEAQTPDANGNLIGSSAGAGVIDPLLDVLANNGGPTLTHKPMNGSPAIAAGDAAFVGPPLFDQRGAPFIRVVGLRIDIGAVEVQSGLLGDYNQNNVVDAADYTTWRDTLTAGGMVLPNDPTPGVVDESDFLYWRAHFGQSLGAGAGAGQGQAAGESEPSPSFSVQATAPRPQIAPAEDSLPSTSNGQSQRVSENDLAEPVSAASIDVGHGSRFEDRHSSSAPRASRHHSSRRVAEQDQLLLAWVAEHDHQRQHKPDAGDALAPWSHHDEDDTIDSSCHVADRVFADLGLGLE